MIRHWGTPGNRVGENTKLPEEFTSLFHRIKKEGVSFPPDNKHLNYQELEPQRPRQPALMSDDQESGDSADSPMNSNARRHPNASGRINNQGNVLGSQPLQQSSSNRNTYQELELLLRETKKIRAKIAEAGLTNMNNRSRR